LSHSASVIAGFVPKFREFLATRKTDRFTLQAAKIIKNTKNTMQPRQSLNIFDAYALHNTSKNKSFATGREVGTPEIQPRCFDDL
jgi:hypothetical protein